MATRNDKSTSTPAPAPADLPAPDPADRADLPPFTEADLARFRQFLAREEERRNRPPRLTDKQAKFLRAVRGGATFADAIAAAGAGGSTEPHGFVYRMIDHGHLTIAVPESLVLPDPSSSDDK